jgi:recombination protein RecA
VLSRKIQVASLLPGAGRLRAAQAWQYSELAGHITELTSHGAGAAMSLAMRLVWEAQCKGEPAAWVTLKTSCFYPPDAYENGIDLDALAVVRVEQEGAIARAADMLVRSGAFGLVILDMGARARMSERQLTRLLGLARKHGTAIVCLTAKADTAASLGGLVSLRGPVHRLRREPGLFVCEMCALKDKRRAPGWRHEEAFRGPAGLR